MINLFQAKLKIYLNFLDEDRILDLSCNILVGIKLMYIQFKIHKIIKDSVASLNIIKDDNTLLNQILILIGKEILFVTVFTILLE